MFKFSFTFCAGEKESRMYDVLFNSVTDGFSAAEGFLMALPLDYNQVEIVFERQLSDEKVDFNHVKLTRDEVRVLFNR